MYKLILLLLVTGCGSYKKKPTIPVDRLPDLVKKSSKYSELVESHQDVHGFIMSNHCDATFFSGLLAAALPSTKIDMRAAASDDLSQWYRRPDKDCGPEFGNSRSTISRDMILGVMWYAWKAKDLEVAETLMEQLYNNHYLLKGEGTIGELLVTPTMLSTLAKIVQKLGGKTYEIELSYPASYNKDGGYVAHLTVWHILLRGELFGDIGYHALDVLEYHKNRNPKNPLFTAAYHKFTDGNQSKAINLLLDNNEWPSNVLPTTANHCSDWPIQRDYTEKDWGSCTPTKEHTGAELILIYQLIIK